MDNLNATLVYNGTAISQVHKDYHNISNIYFSRTKLSLTPLLMNFQQGTVTSVSIVQPGTNYIDGVLIGTPKHIIIITIKLF